jgi:hypothetical protein
MVYEIFIDEISFKLKRIVHYTGKKVSYGFFHDTF